jgi:hypothetical protein
VDARLAHRLREPCGAAVHPLRALSEARMRSVSPSTADSAISPNTVSRARGEEVSWARPPSGSTHASGAAADLGGRRREAPALRRAAVAQARRSKHELLREGDATRQDPAAVG